MKLSGFRLCLGDGPAVAATAEIETPKRHRLSPGASGSGE